MSVLLPLNATLTLSLQFELSFCLTKEKGLEVAYVLFIFP